jgi:hypothetical protein
LSRGGNEAALSGIYPFGILFIVSYCSWLETKDSILWLRCAEYWEEACQASFSLCEGVWFLLFLELYWFSH